MPTNSPTSTEPTDAGRSPLRDWRGRFGVVVCTSGHDRCFYGPSLECPYCEIRSGTNRKGSQ